MSYRPYAAIIAEAQANNSNLTVELLNDSGSTIDELTAVGIDADGKITVIDVSDETSSLKVAGVTTESIADLSSGIVALTGRIENITTSFSHGDYIYVSKTGELQNTTPEIGEFGFLAGDTIIRVGVVVRNANNPSNKDLLVKIQVIGKL